VAELKPAILKNFTAGASKYQNKKIEIKCDYCGVIHQQYQCYIKRSKRHFCSQECKLNFQKKENHPRWKDTGKRIDSHGYVLIKNSEYPHGIYEHRYVMEQFLQRKLTESDFIHHKNEIKTDNRIENLLITTNSSHVKLHNIIFKWSKKYDHCKVCGGTNKEHAANGLCVNCYAIDFRNKRKEVTV
jgi:transposase-like protein